nr:hypothetical protein HCOI_02190100 [Haemonchus contortus]
MFRSSTRDQTTVSSALDSAFQCVERERAAKFRKRSPKTVVNWDHFASLASLWEDSVNDNIDEEYDRLVEHLHNCARKVESLQVTRRLSSKTLELIRQRGIARATGNHQQTSELAKLCREAIKEDLKERRAAVMDEAAEAGKSIRKARRNFANYKTQDCGQLGSLCFIGEFVGRFRQRQHR